MEGGGSNSATKLFVAVAIVALIGIAAFAAFTRYDRYEASPEEPVDLARHIEAERAAKKAKAERTVLPPEAITSGEADMHAEYIDALSQQRADQAHATPHLQGLIAATEAKIRRAEQLVAKAGLSSAAETPRPIDPSAPHLSELRAQLSDLSAYTSHRSTLEGHQEAYGD